MKGKTKNSYQFQATEENDFYLSLLQENWRGTTINQALNQYMSAQALIDIGDGKGIVSFWKKLTYKKKAEVLRRFSDEGSANEKADPELWEIVIKGEPLDFFHMAAKYLTLHQLKYGHVWTAEKEITGAKRKK